MDLPDLSTVNGDELTEGQIRGILAQVDLDIINLLRDGKLSALKYGLPGEGSATTDRGSNLRALISAREHYEALLNARPAWLTSQATC